MTQKPPPKRIIVIGGGISGLAAAHRIIEQNPNADVTLLEASSRVGGVIHTIEKDGFGLETGPDNFVTNKPWGVALCKRVGLEAQIQQTNPAFRRAMIVRDGRLRPIPEGFLMLAPTKIMPVVTSKIFSWPGKLRMAMEVFIRANPAEKDESLASFVIRRFGQEALDRIVQPLIGGIYTADPKELSLGATMPMFLEMERKQGSLIRAMRKSAKRLASTPSGARYSLFVSLKKGMSALPEQLASRIGANRIRLNSRAQSLSQKDNAWSVTLQDGVALEADGVIIAGPAHIAASLIEPWDKELAKLLGQIQYASSGVAHLCYKREQVAHLMDAFGFVVPHIENRKIIAGSFSSVKYPGRAPAGYVTLRAFLGGAMQADLLKMEDDQLLAAAGADMGELLGITGKPHLATLHRWTNAMPQYAVGHLDHVAAIRARIKVLHGLDLAGNAYEGVGIPDCINSGEQAAGRVMDNTPRVP